jgi:hypothetical protein
MSDDFGTTVILAVGDHFRVTFTPSEPISVGDSALAALIGKSENVSVEDGDEIVITLANRKLSHDRHRGVCTEFLKFKLGGGVWHETGIHVTWGRLSLFGASARALAAFLLIVAVSYAIGGLRAVGIAAIVLAALLLVLGVLYVVVRFAHWAWRSPLF